MKTTIILRLSFFLFTFLTLSHSFAQKKSTNNFAFSPNLEMSEKKSSSLKNLDDIVGDAKTNKKILKYFSRNFNNAHDIVWEQVSENFLAVFPRGNTTTRALFNQNGKLIYTIEFWDEKQLPVQIKEELTNKYKNYDITSAAKISEDNRKIWVIKLVGKNDFATVRIENGEMQEVEKFQKG